MIQIQWFPIEMNKFPQTLHRKSFICNRLSKQNADTQRFHNANSTTWREIRGINWNRSSCASDNSDNTCLPMTSLEYRPSFMSAEHLTSCKWHLLSRKLGIYNKSMFQPSNDRIRFFLCPSLSGSHVLRDSPATLKPLVKKYIEIQKLITIFMGIPVFD